MRTLRVNLVSLLPSNRLKRHLPYRIRDALANICESARSKINFLPESTEAFINSVAKRIHLNIAVSPQTAPGSSAAKQMNLAGRKRKPKPFPGKAAASGAHVQPRPSQPLEHPVLSEEHYSLLTPSATEFKASPCKKNPPKS